MHEPPPPPPRPVTRHVRRQAFNEPRVRFWFLITMALIFAGSYFATTQFLNWRTQARLVRSGLVVTATIEDELLPLVGRRVTNENSVTLRYTVDGVSYKVVGFLPVQEGVYMNGGPITIRVDPQRPRLWTNRTEVPSLAHDLFSVTLLLPLIVVSALVCFWFYWRVRSVWERGQPETAIVLETRHTALAPMSRVIRCTPQSRRESIIVTVFIPQRLARVRQGDIIWIINMPHNPWRAIAAVVYMS
jgi:hypothetical protein